MGSLILPKLLCQVPTQAMLQHLAGGLSPKGKRSFISLPQGKPWPAQWIRLDLSRRPRSTLISVAGSGPGRILGYGAITAILPSDPPTHALLCPAPTLPLPLCCSGWSLSGTSEKALAFLLALLTHMQLQYAFMAHLLPYAPVEHALHSAEFGQNWAKNIVFQNTIFLPSTVTSMVKN